MRNRKPRVTFFTTRDGWRLATHRRWSSPRTSRWGPVLLVHGLGANRFNMDAHDPRISLAQYLAERGHDVWVAELRGAGLSRPAGWPLRRRRQFDFDDYVHRDVPALIRGILDRTGATGLHWVGHSMGGMLAYAALEHYDEALFRSVTTLGSPAFTAVKHPVVDDLYRLRSVLNVVSWLPYRTLGRLVSLCPRTLGRMVGHLAANPNQMDLRQIRLLARSACDDLPAALLRQFSEWYGNGQGFCRTDGLFDYYRHLGSITAPVLVVAGAGDRLTPLKDLRYVFDAIGSADKRLLIRGRAQGCRHDYGHIDLVLGAYAREEVYPHIAAWIEVHGPHRRRPQRAPDAQAGRGRLSPEPT